MALKDELELAEAVFAYRDGKLVQIDKEKEKKKYPEEDDGPKKPKSFWDYLGKKDKYPPEGKPSKPPKGPSGTGLDGDKWGGEKYKKPEKWTSAGGVVLASADDLDHVYIRKPTNNYGPWGFAKGRIDKGESQEQAAVREVEEEIGIVAKIVPGGYLGLAEGTMSFTHYYLMYAVKDLHKHDEETEKVLLSSWTEAVHKLAKGGNNRDIKVLTKAMDLVEKIKRKRAAGGGDW